MRLNFEFPEDRVEELKQLQQATRAESMKELVNNAFALLEWAVKETAKGNEIAAVNEQTRTYPGAGSALARAAQQSRVSN